LAAIACAVAGAGAIYLLSSERGRQWLRDMPEYCRGWALTAREAIALVREIAEQVEQSVGSFEQALGRVQESITAREATGTGLARNGGERSLTG
jgi:hypothetical protein